MSAEATEEGYCPHCKVWTDVGPSWNDDGSQMRWDCGVCGSGPNTWVASSDDAGAAREWNDWVISVRFGLTREIAREAQDIRKAIQQALPKP